ncbi:MAG TPA: SH3 domain-containing protein [Clostridia bacterium]|nr:SH3 domain-containing protein [Clostridia bacterium]
MSIRIGHAVMDKQGKTIGLTPSDQTGKEISIAKWYAKNSSGRVWRYYLECTDTAIAERAARHMEQICADSAYGYSQDKVRRWDGYRSIVANSGRTAGAGGDFDCSSLIICCFILAGLNLEQDGYTGDLRAKLLATGKFKSYSDSAHVSSDALAKRGGVFLRNGHVLMALQDNGGTTEQNVKEVKRSVIGRIIVDGVNKWCNVRSGPELEYTIVGRAKKDEVYNVYGVAEEWCQIDYNGTVGYIFGNLASEILPGNV